MDPACPAEIIVAKLKLYAAKSFFIEEMAASVAVCDYDRYKRVFGDDIDFIKKLLSDVILKAFIFIISILIDPDLPVMAAAVIPAFVAGTDKLLKVLRLGYFCVLHTGLSFNKINAFLVCLPS